MTKYCKALTYVDEWNYNGNPTNVKKLFGIIEEKDKEFLVFRTKNARYTINRQHIVSIKDTKIEFKEA